MDCDSRIHHGIHCDNVDDDDDRLSLSLLATATAMTTKEERRSSSLLQLPLHSFGNGTESLAGSRAHQFFQGQTPVLLHYCYYNLILRVNVNVNVRVRVRAPEHKKGQNAWL